jgi:HEPN domain-containing protein
MPPEAGSPGAWLRYAEADLDMARVPLPEHALYEQLCFHAQQAAEKSIKAVLIREGVPFPRVHSIERLVDLLPPSIARTTELVAAAQLSEYATTFRYPGEEEAVSEEEYHEALRIAEAIFAWASARLRD